MASITIERVSRVFPGGVRALDDVSLQINDGEFLVLVGPSGCGKSTLLRSLAGLEETDGGRIWLGETDVSDRGPQERDMAMVFQNYALYPHMTVGENLEFGLKMRKIPPTERATRVADAARILGLDALLNRKPSELSGGQRQRVAMGRAIVRQPQAFLMDEPLSNLDAKLRVTMRAELTKLHQRFGVTTVYVTHDQVEAMTLGTRVAVMRDGVIQQCDSPKVLFDHPVNLFVGAFIGSPSMNLVGGTIGQGMVRAGPWQLAVDTRRFDGPSREAIVGIRPTDFTLGERAPAAWPRVEVTALAIEELGSETMVIYHVDAPKVSAEALTAIHADSGDDQVGLFADENRAQFTARIDGRADVHPGDQITLAIDAARMHFFDPVDGAAW